MSAFVCPRLVVVRSLLIELSLDGLFFRAHGFLAVQQSPVQGQPTLPLSAQEGALKSWCCFGDMKYSGHGRRWHVLGERVVEMLG